MTEGLGFRGSCPVCSKHLRPTQSFCGPICQAAYEAKLPAESIPDVVYTQTSVPVDPRAACTLHLGRDPDLRYKRVTVTIAPPQGPGAVPSAPIAVISLTSAQVKTFSRALIEAEAALTPPEQRHKAEARDAAFLQRRLAEKTTERRAAAQEAAARRLRLRQINADAAEAEKRAAEQAFQDAAARAWRGDLRADD